jgi:gluconolactonase
MPLPIVRITAMLLVLFTWGSLGTDAVDLYQLGPDSLARHPGVPKGRVEAFDFAESKVFAGTTRGCWLYIPAQYDGAKPAALMVFQDGHAYVSETGQVRVPIVFDNLIASGEMPVTIGLFINPGHQGGDGPPANGWGNRSNRSFEYDTLSSDYARFLIEELIPDVTKKWNLNLINDPAMHAICGMSSGGICAWTAAWERPDYFQKVLSHIGSFTNIRGGDVYPGMIRKTERKPIRVFLQDGANDLNNAHGSWPLANQQMARSLAYMGYEFKFEFGNGAHNGKHGGAIMPDSLRWLWNPVVHPERKVDSTDVIEQVPWELVGEGYQFTDAACAHPNGDFYFSDLPSGTVYRVRAATGKPEPWLEKGPKISGMKFGPDGHLYAAVQGYLDDQPGGTRKRIVRIDSNTREIIEITNSVEPNDLVVSPSGWIYYTDTAAGAVAHLPITARGFSGPAPAVRGIVKPNGIALSADGTRLVVSEYGGVHAWSYDLDDAGEVSGGQRNLKLLKPENKPNSGGDGMTLDASGTAWITSHAGIQVFGRDGKLSRILAPPQAKAIVSCARAGSFGEYLYVCCSDKVYRVNVSR